MDKQMITSKIIIAIDDDPARYAHLSSLLLKHNIIIAPVQNPDAVEMLINTKAVIAIFLDHDMPVWNGQHYAKEILSQYSIPVCISSANPEGSKAMASILKEFQTPYKVISVTETTPEERWLGFVLDIAYAKSIS